MSKRPAGRKKAAPGPRGALVVEIENGRVVKATSPRPTTPEAELLSAAVRSIPGFAKATALDPHVTFESALAAIDAAGSAGADPELVETLRELCDLAGEFYRQIEQAEADCKAALGAGGSKKGAERLGAWIYLIVDLHQGVHCRYVLPRLRAAALALCGPTPDYLMAARESAAAAAGLARLLGYFDLRALVHGKVQRAAVETRNALRADKAAWKGAALTLAKRWRGWRSDLYDTPPRAAREILDRMVARADEFESVTLPDPLPTVETIQKAIRSAFPKSKRRPGRPRE